VRSSLAVKFNSELDLEFTCAGVIFLLLFRLFCFDLLERGDLDLDRMKFIDLNRLSNCLISRGVCGPDCFTLMHLDLRDAGFLLLDFLSSMERPACRSSMVAKVGICSYYV
jgi:hypothetical protein